jgi:VWFA-related protein
MSGEVRMRRLPLAVATVLAAATLQAQAPAPSGQPTFRGGTTLVEVSAIVTRDGRPVTDLRAEEVTVLDNGKPQPLTAFERVDLGRGEQPSQRRDFVLVLDDWHIHPTRTAPAADAALAFVDALGPHDRLAVVNTAPTGEIALDLTTGREPARAAIRAFRGQKTGGTPMEAEFRTRRAMEVLGHVASAVRDDARERRAILLVSEGHDGFVQEGNARLTPAGQAAFNDYMQVLREAAIGNVAIYTVDPRGLRAPSTAHLPSSQMVNMGGSENPQFTQATQISNGEIFGSLAILARNTGGIQTLWTNDLTKIFPQVLQDSRQYYRLAYAQPDPAPGKKHPESRSIEVKVARRGLDVRARQRYAPVVGS